MRYVTALVLLPFLLLFWLGVSPIDAPDVLALTSSLAPVPVRSAILTNARRPDPVQTTIQRLQQQAKGQVLVTIKPATGVASFIRLAKGGDLMPAISDGSLADKAMAFLEAYGSAFGLRSPATELVLQGSKTDLYGFTHLSYRQVYHGVPAFGAFLSAHFDPAGHLTAINGTIVPGIKLDPTPELRSSKAAAIAEEAVIAQVTGLQRDSTQATLAIAARSSSFYVFRDGLLQGVPGRDYLVYEVEVIGPGLREFVYVDAHSGTIVNQISGIESNSGPDALNRQVSETALSNVVWSEGDPDPIPAGWAGGSAQQVTDWQNEIDGARETYNLFNNAFGRDSYDGAGATMRTVNNDPNIFCPNAGWDGTSANYCSDVTGDDTVAHEWGHAYTEYTNNLIYQWQSGALNESYSDIWGEVVDLLNGRGDDAPDVVRTVEYCSSHPDGRNDAGYPTEDSARWLSGEDDPAFGGAIRDLWTPECMGDPPKVTSSNYWCSTDDGGGVHTNSGVPNHAFALLVDGGVYNGQTVTGIGLTKAAHIYWRAQSVYEGPSTDFADHADALEAACSDLVGVTLSELSTSAPAGTHPSTITTADCDAVAAANAAVELRTPPTQCNFTPLLNPNAPALCEGLGQMSSIFTETWESGDLSQGWNVGTREVANPASFDTPDWAVVSSLPGGGSPVPGSTYAAFVADLVVGACTPDDTEAGVLWLESPKITLPISTTVPRLAFDHWVATELGWDGGNVKISVNGGPWTLIPGSAFEFNAYPGMLNDSLLGSDNPLAGEPAFTGTDGGSVNGSWGQSQIDLFGLALPGDTVRLRFEMGLDGCNGVQGWYVDDVQLYYCQDEEPPQIICGNGILELGETCDDGNSVGGDGCSSTCQVEDGWICSEPSTDITDPVLVEGFEDGLIPPPGWTQAILNTSYPTTTWSILTGTVYSGNYAAQVLYDPKLAPQDEWLISQPFSLTNAVLTFWSMGSLYWCRDNRDNCDLDVWLVVGPNIGDGDDIYVGRADDDWTATFTWSESTFDLSSLLPGEPVRLGFQYSGQDGAQVGLDAIRVGELVSTPSICYRVSQSLACNAGTVEFDTGIPATWITTTVGNVFWTTTADPHCGDLTNETGGHGEAACANADATNSDAQPYDAQLWSNAFNLSGQAAASLELRWRHRPLNGSSFSIDVSTDGGINWTNVFTNTAGNPGNTAGDFLAIDLAPYLGQPNVIVRFRYQGNGWDWYTQIDQVTLNCSTIGPDIDVSPPNLQAILPPDSQLLSTLNINNQGQAELSWEIGEEPSASTGHKGDGSVAPAANCTNLSDLPWLSTTPISGTLSTSASSAVTVTFTSTGLTPGVYTGNLCISSNDPDPGPGNGTALVIVPVTLTVAVPTAVTFNDLATTGRSAPAAAPLSIPLAALPAATAIGFAAAALLRRRR